MEAQVAQKSRKVLSVRIKEKNLIVTRAEILMITLHTPPPTTGKNTTTRRISTKPRK